MLRPRLIVSSILIGLLGAPLAAHAEHRYLCTSVAGACEYRGPDAPILKAEVCYSPTAGAILKTAECPSGSWPYRIEHGELVDPLTNAVAVYVPLDDACAQPGLCVDGPPPPDAQEYPMCCTSDSQGNETCYDGASCGGTIWWCNDGVCNDDGTITCFDQDPLI